MKSPDEAQLLMQLHVADYQMATSRITNWINLQASLITVLIIFLTLVALAWQGSTPHRVLVWGTVFVVQFVAVCWYFWQTEIYGSARYVEKHLRPLVGKWLEKNESFWTWEEYVARRRGERLQWWEWGNIVPPAIAIVAASIVVSRWKWECWDCAALIMNIVVYGVVVFMATATVNARKEIFT